MPAARGRVEAGVPAALAEFAARRQARTAAMLVAARTNFAMFNEPDPAQTHARDGRLRGLERLDPDGESTFGWLYGHDAIAAAARARGGPGAGAARTRGRRGAHTSSGAGR